MTRTRPPHDVAGESVFPPVGDDATGRAAAAPQASAVGRRSGVARLRPLLNDLALGLAVFACYVIVAALDDPRRMSRAISNGQVLLDIERWLHIDVERPMNHWLAQHSVLTSIANYEYAITYVVSAFAMLFWLYAKRPQTYPFARDSFLALNLVAIAYFAVMPTAPPRMLADENFIDTVTQGDTGVSWGSSLVAHANQVAAMPSLHVAWALWVSAALAALRLGRIVQVVSAAHVLLTCLVVVVTANHFVLDIAGAVVLVALAIAIGRARHPMLDADAPTRVSAADAFFLHVESGAGAPAPQQVGGVVLLDTAALPGGRAQVSDMREVLQAALPDLPRFRQRLDRPHARWRRWRWVPVDQLDWAWHVTEVDVHTPGGGFGGDAALRRVIAAVAATALPRDRPLWRAVLVQGLAADRAVVVLIVHHVVADGIGTIAQALHFLRPAGSPEDAEGADGVSGASAPTAAQWAAGGPAKSRNVRKPPGRLVRAGGIAVGLAQLATDGRARGRLPVSPDGARGYAMLRLPLAGVRDLAKAQGVRVSDVLMSLTASALRVGAASVAGLPGYQLRVAVPLMVRAPGHSAEGNHTAAVMVDLPLSDQSDLGRITAIAGRSATLYTGTRALASRFVMQLVGTVVPPLAHAWFARTVYGHRYFHAIVSNMPGPDADLTLAGMPLEVVFPLLPLAPGAPLALGALGWNGQLCVGIAYDPAFLVDPDAFVEAMESTLAGLVMDPVPHSSTSVSRDRATGSSSAAPNSARS